MRALTKGDSASDPPCQPSSRVSLGSLNLWDNGTKETVCQCLGIEPLRHTSTHCGHGAHGESYQARLLSRFVQPDGVVECRIPLLPRGVACYIKRIPSCRLAGRMVYGERVDRNCSRRPQAVQKPTFICTFFPNFWRFVERPQPQEIQRNWLLMST
jgi:hypothetical protein